MKVLHQSDDIVLIQYIAACCEEAGIKCFVRNIYPPAAGIVQAFPEVCVLDDEQMPEAEKILAGLLNA